MIILLLSASVVASTFRSVISKRISKEAENLANFGCVNALMSFCALSVILLYVIVTRNCHISLYTLLMALLYAAFTVSAQLCYMRALSVGDVSVVTFFYSCGFLIPTFIGTILYHEECSALRIFGVVLLLGAFWLCAARSGAEKTAKKNRWLVYAIFAMCSSGTVGLIQKIHQKSANSTEIGGFLSIAFIVCVCISVGFCLMGKGRSRPSVETVVPSCVCGVCFGGANILNLYLAGVLPALITFPVLNGGVTVAATVAAIFLYGEKPNVRRIVGIILGIAAIVLIAV